MRFFTLSLIVAAALPVLRAEPVQLSGIYPGLTMFNDEGECGTGAVVPWADRLWAITYAPHKPSGSSDKLYEITPDLKQIVRPESVGGTPANRMIHQESGQLFIGPYVIDKDRNVRVIPPSVMFGRHTGNARHLTDPAGKIYYATMEEGLYEVDVKTLAVTELWTDEQKKAGLHADLPGYHGKGLYSSQGRVIYANNGDHAKEALRNPAVPSGVLAEWDGKAAQWTVVRRNQFTEVTGPGGIYGSDRPDKDPVWAVGWDHRSLILQCLDGGKWHSYRLPKSSHSYDGAHGWNTEWPRIREIGEDTLLMTMHGAFWAFPKTFSTSGSGGIRPRSNYLKVIGDFARWNDRVVFGCDDTAKNEFLNKRKAKGEISAPQSQSNLWFVESATLDHLGPVIGRGALWLNEDVAAGAVSDPYLLTGYAHKGLHLNATTDGTATITLEVDEAGSGKWTKQREISITNGYQWLDLSDLHGTWLRLTSDRSLTKATAFFHYRNADTRSTTPDPIFEGLAKTGDQAVTGGLIYARGSNKRTLAFAAQAPGATDVGCYELDAQLKLVATTDASLLGYTKQHTAIPGGILTSDEASVIFVDDNGRRWRLPKGDASFETAGPLGESRVCREVATERDLFNSQGTFYELPAENAGGFAKVRPVATSAFRIQDYCSYRGLLIMTGTASEVSDRNPHLIRSTDGKASLWAGAIDDIWKLGKVRGEGGPWKDTAAKAGVPSDPYLMTAYDKKRVFLSHKAQTTLSIHVEVDVTGMGDWVLFQALQVPSGEKVEFTFPDAFTAYWVRTVVQEDAAVTANFIYE